MSGASFTSELDLHEARAAFARLTDDQLRKVVDNIGEMIENQTKQRIQTEKSSPDGEAWAPWSAEYARLRSGGHSLLENQGHLLTSIANRSSGMEAIVGTDVPYGATHQFGRDGIPARPYLGLTGENREEIERLVLGGLAALLT